MYFILDASNMNRVCHLICPDEDNGWGTDFLEGRSIESPTGRNNTVYIHFECEKIELPDYFEVDGVPVTNNKFLNCFKDACINDIQKFQADIHFMDGKVSGYYVLMQEFSFAIFNIETTKATKLGKHIMRILDLKLYANETCTTEIFRDPAYKQIIFISDRIKNAIESNNITGCNIKEAEGWNDLSRF